MKSAAALAAALSLISTSALAQSDFDNVSIKTTLVKDGIYMLEGAGGNIGLVTGDDGAFVIDDQYAPLSDKIIAAIAKVTDKPVEFVLNTHYHGDHTGGNEAFGETGALIVAHENVRARLFEDEDVAAGALPVITFSKSATFYRNGKEIVVFHPEGAHTDGDSIVFFRNINVMHMGDILFSGMYPYIDVAAGGDVDGYIAAMELAAAKADAKTKIIPGHGPLSSKVDLQRSIAMLKDARARISALIDEGLDEEAVIAAAPLSDLDAQWSWDFINGERMTRSVYQSLTNE